MPTSPGQRAADCQPRGRSARLSPQQVVNGLLGAGAAVLGLIVVGQVVQSMIWHIRFPYEIKGWAEGHSLYNALQFSRGENIYVDPDMQPVTTMGYGFLYPLLMAPLVRLFGAELWIPRVVSALAALASLGWVFRTASVRARSPIAGACGIALASTGYFLTGESWDWGHSDSLYVFLGLGSLMCVQSSGAMPGWRRIAAAVVLSCASCCAKQSGGGFILAIATSLFIRRWRSGVVYLVSCGVVMTLVGLVGQLLTDGWFIRYTLGVVVGRPFFPDKVEPLVLLLISRVPLLLMLCGLEIKKSFPRSGWSDPIAWALLWVGLASLSVYLGHGGLLNALMPVFFLLSVPAAVRLSDMIRARQHRALDRSIALVVLVAQLLLIQYLVVPETLDLDQKILPWYLRAGKLIEAELRDPNERVLVGDRVSFAVLAGRPVYDSVAIANYGKGYPAFLGWLREKMQKRLKRQFAERFFDKILIPREEVDQLESDIVQTLHESYKIERVLQPETHLPFCTPMLVFKPIRSATRPVSMPSRQHGADIPGLNRSPFLSIGTACCSHPKPRPASSDSWTVRGPTW